MHVNRTVVRALAVPAVAVIALGVVLLVVRHPASTQTGSGTGHEVTRTVHHQSCIALPATAHFVGVAINPPIVGSVKSFADATSVHPALVEFYTRFGAPFRDAEARQANEAGAVPFIQLNPRSAPPARIARGRYDAYLRRYAEQIKAFGCPVVLSFGHEMNGSWYPWGRPRTTPAEFIAAWRHIYHIFAAGHVTNVTWAWDPTHGGTPANRWWPGSAYVNWIGLDGYLHPGKTFSQIFSRQLSVIRRLTNKPVFIAETGVAPGAGAARQIAGLFNGLRQFHMAGLVWFDINRLAPWRIDGRSAAARAFGQAAASLAKS